MRHRRAREISPEIERREEKRNEKLLFVFPRSTGLKKIAALQQQRIFQPVFLESQKGFNVGSCIIRPVNVRCGLMFSRSASVKLKAILIIDLIIISGAAGAYFYLQNQGVIGGVTKPAKFILTNLTIDPTNATEGDAVQIAVNVTNVGDLEGNDTINFEVNNVVKNTQNVTLEGAATQVLSYNDIETTFGNYSVQVGDLTGSFVINPAPPGSSKIILSDVNAFPYEAWPGQPVNITATAQNPTTQPDKLTVRVTVDGAWVETKVIELNASETENRVVPSQRVFRDGNPHSKTKHLNRVLHRCARGVPHA